MTCACSVGSAWQAGQTRKFKAEGFIALLACTLVLAVVTDHRQGALGAVSPSGA
jgi:hypothetical protein